MPRRHNRYQSIQVRRELSERLRVHQDRAGEAIFDRVRSISAAAAPDDADYLAGLRRAVIESLEYAIVGIEMGERPTESIPVVAGEQARRSARSGVSLDTVLRRYHAGDRLLSELILGEAGDIPCSALREVMRAQGILADHFTGMIAAEYGREVERIRQSPADRLGERVRTLLKGGGDGDPELRYGLGAWHLGLIGFGDDAEAVVRDLAGRFRCQSLCVPGGGEEIWAWLGRRSRISASEIERALRRSASPTTLFAIGEARYGIGGWRLTHREAQAVLCVMSCRPQPVTRSRDAILAAAVLQNPVLAESLIETYLKPLEGRSRAGVVLRETLRAYFKANQNAAASAAALGVARHTVERRLRRVEEKLDQPLLSCGAQLQVALDAEQLLAAARDRIAGGAKELELLEDLAI